MLRVLRRDLARPTTLMPHKLTRFSVVLNEKTEPAFGISHRSAPTHPHAAYVCILASVAAEARISAAAGCRDTLNREAQRKPRVMQSRSTPKKSARRRARRRTWSVRIA